MEKREETLSPKLEKQINSLISLISKLDHIEFIGLAKILSVQLLQENKEPKNFEDILLEILDNFAKLSSKGRKQAYQSKIPVSGSSVTIPYSQRRTAS